VATTIDNDEPGKPKTSQRFSDELIEEARAVFQPQTDRHLTAEDGRQILENLVGFFSVLHEWDLSEAEQGQSGKSDS
jgi:hypothetical protein